MFMCKESLPLMQLLGYVIHIACGSKWACVFVCMAHVWALVGEKYAAKQYFRHSNKHITIALCLSSTTHAYRLLTKRTFAWIKWLIKLTWKIIVHIQCARVWVFSVWQMSPTTLFSLSLICFALHSEWHGIAPQHLECHTFHRASAHSMKQMAATATVTNGITNYNSNNDTDAAVAERLPTKHATQNQNECVKLHILLANHFM